MDTQSDMDSLAEAIVRRIRESHHTVWLDPDTHASQHEFLKMLMDERAERIERRKRIEDKIAGSVILTTIIGVVTILGAGVLDYLRSHLK